MPDREKRDGEKIAENKLALTMDGCFTISEHGIADEVLKSSYRGIREFLSLSDGIKNT